MRSYIMRIRGNTAKFGGGLDADANFNELGVSL